MDMGKTRTSELLKKWHAGDESSLEALINLHLPWICRYVRSRLGPALRTKAETDDFVQDAMIQFLRYGPRIALSANGHFRCLVARIVENTIRDKNDWFRAKRRAMAREKPLPSDTVISLDPPRQPVKTPSRIVQAGEEEAWIRLGIELIEPADRSVIVMREWEKLAFAEIGERFGITANAAEKRFRRAVQRLGEKIGKLRRGRFEDLAPDAFVDEQDPS